jgi:hypothetical protein
MAGRAVKNPDSPANEVVTRVSEELWCALIESLEDSPGKTERLILLLGRLNRPVFGSVTIVFRDAKIVNTEVKETFQ